MPNYCSHCGARVVGSESQCLQCGTRLVCGGWLARLWGGLFARSHRVPGQAVLKSSGAADGPPGAALWLDGSQKKPILSWRDLPDDLPEELRAKLQALRRSAAERGEAFEINLETQREFIYKDESGVERRFESLEEMPPEIRRLFEDASQPNSGRRKTNPNWPL